MAGYVDAYWERRFEGMSRRDRRGGPYRAYVPDELLGWELMLPGDLAADVADAEAAVRALSAAGVAHASLEGLARFLLRVESVSSSHIEGLDASARRLNREELSLAQGGEVTDRIAAAILGNVAAMDAAIRRAAEPESLRVEDLLAIHAELMQRSRTPDLAGVVRATQNWIGGSSFHPLAASFVPPPPDRVEPLLRDLIDYVNRDEHSPLVQAAIAHAQFETIHPFADGNGRTGRALVHVVLRRRGLAKRLVPPVSLVLATWSRDYVGGLMAFRHTAQSQSTTRSRAAHDWIRTFAAATHRACLDAQEYADSLGELVASWRRRLGRARRDSASARLLSVLPGSFVFTVSSASRAIGRSVVSTSLAVKRLEAAGIVTQRGPARQRYRAFEAREVIAVFTALERKLASPSGNTQASPPERPVPRSPPDGKNTVP